jgi:hypothetical protein
MWKSLLLLVMLAFDVAAQPVRINLREVPLKAAIHTIYSLTLKLPIVISPPIVASDKKVTVDVTLAIEGFREFADSFVASQGVVFANKGGALMFDFSTLPAISQKAEPTNTASSSTHTADDTPSMTSLRDQLRFAVDCWLSTFEPPRFSVQCLDGDVFSSDELQSLKPRVDVKLRQVSISGAVYRNRTPAAFFVRQSPGGNERASKPLTFE